MSLKKYVVIYHRIDLLVRTQSTGSPSEFAGKLGVSERQLYNYMRDFKELGHTISYSEHSGSYCYAEA